MKRTSLVMTLVMLAIFVALVAIASRYPANARFMPFVVGVPAIGLCLLQLVLDLRRQRASPAGVGSTQGQALPTPAVPGPPSEAALPHQADAEPSSRETLRRELVIWASFLSLIGSILLFGFWIAIPVFLVGFLRFQARAAWRTSLLLGIGATVILYLGLEWTFQMELHRGFAVEYLRDWTGA